MQEFLKRAMGFIEYKIANWEVEISRDRRNLGSNWTKRRVSEWFYPRSKRKRISSADKFIGPVIIIAIVIALFETYFVLFQGNKYSNFFMIFSVLFLAFFVLEFALRLWVRGLTYFLRWGLIDLIPIAAETFSLVGLLIIPFLLKWDIGNEASLTSFAAILRTIRLLRVARLGRLMADGRYWKSRALILAPYVGAAARSFFYAGCVLIVIQLLISTFIGRDPLAGIVLTLESLRDTLDLDPESETSTFDAIGALIVSFSIANLVALFFVPEGQRIAEEQKRSNPYKHMSSHVVIYIENDKYATILQEIIALWSRFAQRDVVVIVNENSNTIDLPTESGATHVIQSSSKKVDVWQYVSAENADAIFLIGNIFIPLKEFPMLLSYAGEDMRSIPIFQISDEKYSVSKFDEPVNCRIINVPFALLKNNIEETAWKAGSAVHTYMSRLSVDLDAPMPSSVTQLTHIGNPCWKLSVSDSDDLENQINSIQDTNYVLIEASEPSKKLGSSASCGDNEDAYYARTELSIISKLHSCVIDGENNIPNKHLFIYVRTLHYWEWNLIFQDYQKPDQSITIIPIELQIALALYHEVELPGSLEGWLFMKEKIAEEDSSFESIPVAGVGRAGRLMSNQDIMRKCGKSSSALLILHQDGRKNCFLDLDSDRIRIRDNDRVVFRNSG